MPQRCHLPRVLLLVETAGAFGRGIVEGIGRYAKENGPWLIQYQYRSLESMPPRWLAQWRGDGIISRTVSATQATMLRRTKLPLVELHGHPKFGAPHVKGNESLDAEMAVEHFLDCRLRQFAYFSFADAWWSERVGGVYCSELQQRGYDCQVYRPRTKTRNVAVWDESQRPGLIKWLRSLPRPIGVYTPGDLHSVCLLETCRELDLAVPEEIAILGRGNDRVICETVHPTLSSIDLDARRFGYEAAGVLDQMMAGKPPKETISVSPSHVAVRQSTDLVAINDPNVAKAVRFIREWGCRDINVARVAEEVGLSRRVLERRFLEHLGRAPKSEIMRVRIEHAKILLAQTDHSGESIARKCSFTSLAYFTRAFHREVGMTTRAYRAMHRVSRDWGGKE